MSKKPSFDTDKADHWFGVEFNNSIHPLLEKANRTEEETEKMIAMAYASALHWSRFTDHTKANIARGEYMIAATLANAGRKESALHHAKRNYNIVFDNQKEMADFDFSYALMVCARAFALNGEMETAKKFLGECIDSIENIKDPEDKKIVEMDFNSGPWYGLNR